MRTIQQLVVAVFDEDLVCGGVLACVGCGVARRRCALRVGGSYGRAVRRAGGGRFARGGGSLRAVTTTATTTTTM